MIAAVEMAERFSFYGCSVVFTNFIQWDLPSRTGAGGKDGQAGALGMGQQASTGLTTFYSCWCYVTPLLGAYLADAHWGRFNTICVGVAVAMVGHVILIVAAIPGIIERQQQINPIVIHGDFYRLALPDLSNWPAAMFVYPDASSAVLFAFQIRSKLKPLPSLLKLKGLDPAARYTVGNGTASETWSGSTLMNVGLSLEWESADYQSVILFLDKQ